MLHQEPGGVLGSGVIRLISCKNPGYSLPRFCRYSIAFTMCNQHLLLMTSGKALIPSLNTGSNV